MAWRAARSLPVLQRQLQAMAPRAAPSPLGVVSANEWGLIGDAVHDPASDHSPHDFPGWGNDIVTAGDFPNRPDLGLNAFDVLDSIRRSHDPRAKYGISNAQIFSNHPVTQGGRTYGAYEWRPYRRSDGSRYADEHWTHGHLSVVGDSRADGTQPWQITGAPTGGQEDEDDMGASFGPIDVEREGPTSLTIPPVQAGAADPRPAWLNVCNDTFGTPYALRLWYTTGDGVFHALPVGETDGSGVAVLKSGQRLSVELPKNTGGLSIMRKAIGKDGKGAEPTADLKPYAGHLTVAIERGRVSS